MAGPANLDGGVYVSNTWNHMMDTSDTNWDFAKSRVP